MSMSYLERFARKHSKNAIAFKLTDGKTEPLKTKIGGKPELPSDFEWYYYEGEDFSGVKKSRPLSFMAQINCAEIKSFDKDDLLPDTGMLYFFYELETMEWGYSPEHSGSARVYYYDGDMTELSQRDFPNDLDEEWIIPEKILNFQCFNDIPDLCEADEYFGLCNNKEYDEDEDDGRYFDLREKEFGDDVRIKLLGYADTIQDMVQYGCEYVARGYSLGYGLPKISDEIKSDIESHEQDWILLFQLDTIESENYQLMFGDCGRIYFMIRKNDLAQRNFDNVQLILQCC